MRFDERFGILISGELHEQPKADIGAAAVTGSIGPHGGPKLKKKRIRWNRHGYPYHRGQKRRVLRLALFRFLQRGLNKPNPLLHRNCSPAPLPYLFSALGCATLRAEGF